MERIGIAASKMAKDNLFLYNLYVLFLSCLIALVLFLVAGIAVILALLGIGVMAHGFMPSELKSEWFGLVRLCFVSLTVTIGLIMAFAVVKNIKFSKSSS